MLDHNDITLAEANAQLEVAAARLVLAAGTRPRQRSGAKQRRISRKR